MLAFDWDGSGVAALILAAIAAAGAVDRFWYKRRNKHHADVADKLDDLKVELMGHVTANRVQSDRMTRRVAADLERKMDESHGIMLDMMSDLEAKVTKKANTTRTAIKVPVSSEKVSI